MILAGALILARTGVLAALARSGRGVEPDAAQWAAASHLSTTTVHALAVALAASALVFGARRPLAVILALAISASLCLSVVSGWPLAAPVHVAGGEDALGIAANSALAFVVLAACAGLWLASLVARGTRLGQTASRAPFLALAALAGLIAPVAWVARSAMNPPTMPVRDIVTDLVQAHGRWSVVREDAEHRSTYGVMSPTVDLNQDGGDKPSIVMPPECELAIVIAPDEDGARLHAAAGFDRSVRLLLPEFGGRLRLRFEISIDGKRAYDEILVVRTLKELRDTGSERENAWQHVGGREGIPVHAGARITFRTSLPDFEADALPASVRGLTMGFGGVTIERELRRPRMRSDAERPNVVFIVIDTLRADRMSSYGYGKPTTPHVDRLAERGLLFESAYATGSWTLPSTASFLTGLLADEHGVTSKESCTLDLSFETLAEALQGRGFTTAAFSCNPLIAPERYFDQGFESFDSSPDMRPTSAVIGNVVATIERLADSRFFLYLHFIDPHTPHEPLPSELARLGGSMPADFPTLERNGKKGDGMDVYAGRLRKGETVDAEGRAHPEQIVPESHARWISDSYDACVGTADYYCGIVFDALERMGLDDRTVIAFTSDHGEELFDHGLLDHSHTLHPELTHVPLILAGPGIPRGERVSREVSNRFLANTLASFGAARMRGVRDPIDLLRLPPDPAPIFYATERGWWRGRDKDAEGRSIKLYGGREGGYVVHFAPGLPDEPFALYEIASDPREHANLSERPDSRERALEMKQRFKKMLSEQQELQRNPGFGVGASGINALQGLGYIGGGDDDSARDDAEKQN